MMMKNGQKAKFRHYVESDFPYIQALNEQEGWMNLVKMDDQTKKAWQHSQVKLVAVSEGNVVGYVRGLTDGNISLYICELIIDRNYRGQGIAGKLLSYAHSLYPSTRMELLGSSSSHSYYEQLNFRPFYGFRKTIDE
ncbi:GNAT family N-acetyltransferase [Falsibacillus albus]|nr:GNAT family N-acetyltransferase [Falsibacillus albus]